MKRKNPKCVSYQSIREMLDNGVKPAEVAKKLGISEATVYRAKRMTEKRYDPPAKPRKPSPVALSLSITLPALAGEAEVKLRNGGGELLGTILLAADGISYRRPKQKTPADRKISWATLDKLMALGIG